MSKIREYIPSRIKELEDSLGPLQAQHADLQQRIAAAQQELSELRSAAKAIGIENGLPEQPLGVSRREKSLPTIKEAVLAILANHPKGLIALDILAKINSQNEWTLTRTSLSPQLSRLKQENKIINHGSTWILTSDPRP